MPYTNPFTFSCHTSSVNCLSFSSDGRYLASGGDDSTLFVHDCDNGGQVYKLRYDRPVTAILWHPHHHMWAFIGFGDGKVLLMEVSYVSSFDIFVVPY